MREKLKTVVVMGTLDTKGPELAYLAQQVRSAGCLALLMDVGVHGDSGLKADIPASTVAAAMGEEISSICALPRGEAVEKIGRAAAAYLHQMIESGEAHGVIGVGGCVPVKKEGP